jgi:hypothetical protein
MENNKNAFICNWRYTSMQNIVTDEYLFNNMDISVI